MLLDGFSSPYYIQELTLQCFFEYALETWYLSANDMWLPNCGQNVSCDPTNVMYKEFLAWMEQEKENKAKANRPDILYALEQKTL